MKPDGTERIHFDGIALSGTKNECHFTAVGSFKRNDFTDLDLNIFWQGDSEERMRGEIIFMANQMNFLRLPNADPEGPDLELHGLTGYGTEHSKHGPISTRPEFDAVYVGIDRKIIEEEREYHLNARFLPSGVFTDGMERKSYTGEIAVDPIPWQKPITISSAFGELLLRETFEWEYAQEHGSEVLKRHPCSTLSGKLLLPKGSSLYQAHETIWEEIESLQTALGFCFRQSVRFVHLSYQDMTNLQRPKAYHRRRLQSHKQKLRGDPFIAPRNLAEGALQRMLEKLRTIEDSKDLQRAMEFLSVSHESTLENAFFMAFSALETVVNLAVKKQPEQDAAKSGRDILRSALEKTVREISKAHGLDSADLLAKLREFDRPSFRRRVAKAVATLGPETDDLWPGRDVLDGISEAAAIRNGLFHAAEYSDGQALFLSLVRVRAFAERLIAKLLEWPNEALWVHRDQNLRLINIPQPADSARNGKTTATK